MEGLRNTSLSLFFALLTLAGCRGTPEPVSRATPPPATKPAAAPAVPAASKPATPPAPVREAEPTRDDTAVVVDPGDDDEGGPVTLAEAAKAERERRARAGRPVAVITDKTLPQYARKGQITVADPKDKKGAAAPAPAAPSAQQEPVRDEQYWRNRALEIRLRWRQAADDMKELEQRSTELRQRFYAETDSFVRDNQIKPEWDRVLDRLRQSRSDVDTAKRDLAQLHEDGRVAGALPGWLREGEDQEPAPDPEREKLPPAQSIEPPVLNDNGGDGGGR